MTNIYRSAVLAVAAAASVSAYATVSQQADQAIAASKVQRGQIEFWRSDAAGVLFGFDERWAKASTSQPNTLVAINWSATSSSGLMATCSLEVTSASDLSKLPPAEVSSRSREIAEALVRNASLRDPNAVLVTWRAAQQDNHPVVYAERDMAVQNLDRRIEMRVYSITTAWRGKDIQFECASEIPRRFPVAAGVVEFPIRKVLGSLQFIR